MNVYTMCVCVLDVEPSPETSANNGGSCSSMSFFSLLCHLLTYCSFAVWIQPSNSIKLGEQTLYRQCETSALPDSNVCLTPSAPHSMMRTSGRHYYIRPLQRMIWLPPPSQPELPHFITSLHVFSTYGLHVIFSLCFLVNFELRHFVEKEKNRHKGKPLC